jgi:hypothetical protein
VFEALRAETSKRRPLSRSSVMEPRKHYDIANILAAVAVLFFLAAAVILFHWFSHKTPRPSAHVPSVTTVR